TGDAGDDHRDEVEFSTGGYVAVAGEDLFDERRARAEHPTDEHRSHFALSRGYWVIEGGDQAVDELFLLSAVVPTSGARSRPARLIGRRCRGERLVKLSGRIKHRR